MFYVKTEIADSVKIIFPLFEDEVFSLCIKCGKELTFEPDELADILKDGGFASTSIKCGACNESLPPSAATRGMTMHSAANSSTVVLIVPM